MIVIVEVDIVHVSVIMIVACHVLNEVIYCLISKINESQLFFFQGITCPFLTPPEHGQISYSNENKFGSRATYECEQGFILEGPKHRHCQGDMWWGPSDSIPYCTKEGNRTYV